MASNTSVTFVYQNNLNASDDANHVGALILDPMSRLTAASACATFGESLISKDTLNAHSTDFVRSLAYQSYARYASPSQSYYIREGVVVPNGNQLSFQAVPAGMVALPVLCTQSSQSSQPTNSNATTTNTLTVSSSGNRFVGYRNQKSFRFLGIPYADEPKRFQYSQLYSPQGQTISATTYGQQCAQVASGSEACHFLNIQTPYIPRAGSTKNLRPVMFWIHGGGFTGGTGADPLSDGGNLASREDIVVVTFNYRLSTLGFLAIPNSKITGNYGIGDQITALQVSSLNIQTRIQTHVTQWTINNIAAFGGDPKKITIVGESAVSWMSGLPRIPESYAMLIVNHRVLDLSECFLAPRWPWTNIRELLL